VRVTPSIALFRLASIDPVKSWLFQVSAMKKNLLRLTLCDSSTKALRLAAHSLSITPLGAYP
jgi:hypothetical protein